ncbi:MAG: hypothetical protein CMJ83_22505 [Planctomycetes bacterium]|nr:hypothetical protein [Planctomycetota bacterium]
MVAENAVLDGDAVLAYGCVSRARRLRQGGRRARHGWALVRFFRTADDGIYAKWFKKLEARFSRNEDRAGFIKSTPWTEKELERRFISWLRRQMPRHGDPRGGWTAGTEGPTALYVPGCFASRILAGRAAPGESIRLAYTFSALPGLEARGPGAEPRRHRGFRTMGWRRGSAARPR